MWIDGNRIILPETGPASDIQAIFFNSYTKVGGERDVWHVRELKGIIPDDSVGIHVTGILIITHGAAQETADLQLFLRKDALQNTNYAHQTIEAEVGNGQRSTMSAWIPLALDKSFQWKWSPVEYKGEWPAYSAYGANLHVDAVLVKN